MDILKGSISPEFTIILADCGEGTTKWNLIRFQFQVPPGLLGQYHVICLHCHTVVLCGFGVLSGLGMARPTQPQGDVSLSSLSWSGLPATTRTKLFTYKLLRMKSSLKPASLSSVEFPGLLAPAVPSHFMLIL